MKIQNPLIIVVILLLICILISGCSSPSPVRGMYDFEQSKILNQTVDQMQDIIKNIDYSDDPDDVVINRPIIYGVIHYHKDGSSNTYLPGFTLTKINESYHPKSNSKKLLVLLGTDKTYEYVGRWGLPDGQQVPGYETTSFIVVIQYPEMKIQNSFKLKGLPLKDTEYVLELQDGSYGLVSIPTSGRYSDQSKGFTKGLVALNGFEEWLLKKTQTPIVEGTV